MIIRTIKAELFKDGIYFNGETVFKFNIKLIPTSDGFDWEVEVPNQPLIVTGHKYNQETGEDDPFTLNETFSVLNYKIKLRNKEAISSGQFNIETIHIDPKSKKLEIEFN